MGLCKAARCACGIKSETFSVMGDGSETNPYQIETTPVITGLRLGVPSTVFSRNSQYPSPTDGQEAYVTSLDQLHRFIDSSWVVVEQPYTVMSPVPTIGGITVNNGSMFGAYRRAGDSVFYNGRFVFGSTSVVSGGLGPISVPVPIALNNREVGALAIYDASTARIHRLQCDARQVDSGLSLYRTNGITTFAVSGTSPITFAIGDELWWSIRYWAA